MLFFKNKSNALDCVRRRNRNGAGLTWVVVDGPENNFAVMELMETIENEFNYEWDV